MTLTLAGCAPAGRGSDTVAEGVIWSIAYQTPEGRSTGFTRAHDSGNSPGRSGSSNVDAYGRLTPDFPLITWPGRKDLGPQIIPVSRLFTVQFGDGSIKQVEGNPPAPGK